MPNLIKRKFQIKVKGKAEMQTVIQLQNLSWPDHGTPEEEDCAILKVILDYIREHHQTNQELFETDLAELKLEASSSRLQGMSQTTR